MSSILVVEDHAAFGQALVRLLSEKANLEDERHPAGEYDPGAVPGTSLYDAVGSPYAILRQALSRSRRPRLRSQG